MRARRASPNRGGSGVAVGSVLSGPGGVAVEVRYQALVTMRATVSTSTDTVLSAAWANVV